MNAIKKSLLSFFLFKIDISKKNIFLKEGGWILLSQAVTFFGTLLLIKVLTSKLSPSIYGELTLGLTVSSLINNIISGGINNGIARFYAIANDKNDLKGYFGDSLKLQCYVSTFIISFGSVLIGIIFLLGYTKWLLLLTASLLLSLLSGLNSTFNGIQFAARQRAVLAFNNILESCLKILLSVCFILFFGSNAANVVFGYAVSSFIVIISQLFFLGKAIPIKKGFKGNGDWIKKIWMFSWPFSTWGLFAWFQQVSDRWILSGFGKIEDVGNYSVLFQIGYSPIILASSMFMSFLSPILFQRLGDATNKNKITSLKKITIKFTWLCLGLTIFCFTLSFILHKFIFKILLDVEYQKFSYLLPWMVLAGGFMAAHSILGSRISSLLKTKELALQQIFMFLIAVGLNFLGVITGGLNGIVASLVLFSFIYFLWMYFFSNSLIKKELLNS